MASSEGKLRGETMADQVNLRTLIEESKDDFNKWPANDTMNNFRDKLTILDQIDVKKLNKFVDRGQELLSPEIEDTRRRFIQRQTSSNSSRSAKSNLREHLSNLLPIKESDLEFDADYFFPENKK